MLKNFIILLALIFSINVSADDLDSQIDSSVQDLSVPMPQEKNLDESVFTKMMSDRLKSMVAEYIKENPFSKMTESEVKTLIDARTNGTVFGKYLQKSPRLYGTILEIVRDKQAIPSFFSIVNKTESLKKFGYCALGIFIFTFIYSTFFITGGIFKKILKKVGISLLGTIINIGLVYYFFGNELRPSFNIIFKYFHL